MRKILMLGTAAIVVTLGGVKANADNPHVPSWSPYAIMGDDAAPPAAPGAMEPGPMIERRAAYANAHPDMGYGYDGWQVTTPEDWTRYSRGVHGGM